MIAQEIVSVKLEACFRIDVFDEAPTTPQQHYSSDESEDIGQNTATSAGDEPSMSFVSSFTSLSTDTMRPKRTRQSFSSPTQGSRFPKSRSRLTASQCSTDSPISTTKSKLSELDVPYCVETNACKGKICFQNSEGQEVNTELRDWKEGIVNGTQMLVLEEPKVWTAVLDEGATNGATKGNEEERETPIIPRC